MRLSFTYFALALPLLAASQANYTVSSKGTGYHIYVSEYHGFHSPVNVTDVDYPSPAALTVSPTLTGNGAQDVTISNGSLHIGISVDPNSGPLVVWTDTPYTWRVSPQPEGVYSVMDPNYGKGWLARAHPGDIVLVPLGEADEWVFQEQ